MRFSGPYIWLLGQHAPQDLHGGITFDSLLEPTARLAGASTPSSLTVSGSRKWLHNAQISVLSNEIDYRWIA